ncbi:MAG: GtrA family protein [Oscillospiraceae bacterium]|nr:GtrA family protein [Oscillospiraceae bacterium]
MAKTTQTSKSGLSREVVLYLVFGVLTTALNIFVQYAISFAFSMDDVGKVWIANPIAWVAGVVFAYVTNRIFVFQSKKQGGELWLEAGEFVAARLVTLLFDQLVMWLLVGNVWFLDRIVASILNLGVEEANNLDAKIIANVLVVILNYVFSKLFIFKKKQD